MFYHYVTDHMQQTITGITKVQKFEQFEIDVQYENADSTQFEEIIYKFYEYSRANASCVTNTNDYYRAPFEGETVIIMIILKLGGTQPSRNKLQVCLLCAVDIAPQVRSIDAYHSVSCDRERHCNCRFPQFLIAANMAVI